MSSTFLPASVVLVTLALASAGSAQDWPQWGRDASKNMVAPDAKNLPRHWTAGESNDDGLVDLSTTTNIRYTVKLGSQSYGNPTVAGGRLFIGTNNDSPRDKRFEGDHSLVYCLDEKTGDLLWQFTAPKIGSGKVGDWEYLGICSSPTVDGDRVYFTTNRYEVVCVDVKGMADGNQGYQDEGKYLVGLNTPRPPMEVKPTDADILWRFDMAEELGVFPHNITSSSVLIAGDLLFASTSNGVDWSHTNIPNPKAPSLICLDKNTGKLMGEEIAGIGQRILHGGWSSPSHGVVGGKGLVFFGGPDGFLYAFSDVPKKDPEDPEIFVLEEVFRCDGNLPSYRVDKQGKPIKYVKPEGPSEFIATPVFYKDRVYAAIGQDPEHGDGIGRLICVDASKTGDISKTGVVWDFTKINRAISTVSIHDGLLYVADFAGIVYCLDLETGALQWKHDTLSHVWGSTLWADGKVYLGNEDGVVSVFVVDEWKKLVKDLSPGFETTLDTGQLVVKGKDGKKSKLEKERTEKLFSEVQMPGSVYSTPVYANGVLYIATGSTLYAVENKGVN